MAGDVQIKREILDIRQILEDAGFTKGGVKPRSTVMAQIKDLDKRLAKAESRAKRLESQMELLIGKE